MDGLRLRGHDMLLVWIVEFVRPACPTARTRTFVGRHGLADHGSGGQ